ncbi:MAG: S8 family serine peptidase, partial [Solirubrobacterales bacterium]
MKVWVRGAAIVAACVAVLAVLEAQIGDSILRVDAGPGVSAPPKTSTVSDHGAPVAYVPDQLLVGYEKGATTAQRRAARRRAGAISVKPLPVKRVELLALRRGADVHAAAKRFGAGPATDFAEPNYLRKAVSIPTDPLFDRQWALHNVGQDVPGQGPNQSFNGMPDADIDAPEAWDLSTGLPATTIAVVDTGVEYQHEDLAGGIWRNPGENGTDGGGNPKKSNGIDDDSNGFVDDWQGWDFRGNANYPSAATPDNDPNDQHYHGTHVSGIIGARANNGVGISGVDPNAAIMPLRFLDVSGYGTSADSAAALAYAGNNGARVVNGSYGSPAASQAEAAAIAQHPNTLYVFAAGNDATDVGVTPAYPCAYSYDNEICVASTTSGDD